MTWRSVPGWPYAVSSTGRVRSLRTGRSLRLATTPNGYMQVRLCLGGRQWNVYVHRLVLTCFAGDEPSLQCNHKNGVKRDNRIANLEWCTSSENARHAFVARLRTNTGEHNPRARLTEKSVLRIRRLLLVGTTQVVLGKKFGVSRSTIKDIASGKSWRGVL